MQRVIVIGAGLFGLTGARELSRRGAAVTLLEAGAAPRDVAGSTDVSRIVRPDYGDDVLYTELGERAFDAWPEWDARLGGGLFHHTGLLVATRVPLEERPMEAATFALLSARGHALERLRGDAIPVRFPGLAGTSLIDGYFNPDAGWVASGAAIDALASLAREEG
ncbi:MAG: FAD-dependent oxidoreductase, partial [Planctomycetota bacterium]|nr:FAD-dependent oxidoreductase [Planctomycetota bacterium]